MYEYEHSELRNWRPQSIDDQSREIVPMGRKINHSARALGMLAPSKNEEGRSDASNRWIHPGPDDDNPRNSVAIRQAKKRTKVSDTATNMTLSSQIVTGIGLYLSRKAKIRAMVNREPAVR